MVVLVQLVRTLRCGRRCQRFESAIPHNYGAVLNLVRGQSAKLLDVGSNPICAFKISVDIAQPSRATD